MAFTSFTPRIPDRPSILMARLSAIGDCIHTVPLATAVRRRWPQAHVVWVTQPGPATLLKGHPALDDLIVVPRDWMKSPAALSQLRTRLHQHHWDAAIDVQSLTKSALIAWLSGARNRIGFAAPQGRELSRWFNRTRVVPQQTHVVDRYLELLQPLGITQPPVDFALGPYTDQLPTVHRMLERYQLGPQRFALINPGAGWNSKLWPARRFGAVAKYLGHEHQLPSLVVWNGPEEHQAAGEIVAAAGGHAFLAPDTTLPQLAELTRRARLFVGSDTGPLHLAAAVGTRCVALFGPTDPKVCGPYGTGHRCVQSFLQDQRGRRRAANDAMCAIEVHQVQDACQQILTDSASQRSAA